MARTLDTEYRYREGVNGEHCVDLVEMQWTRLQTVGRAATKDDAQRIATELNVLAREAKRG